MRYRLRSLLVVLAVAPPVLAWAVTDPLSFTGAIVALLFLGAVMVVPVLMLAFLWKHSAGFIGPDDETE
jgi:hypothetical protein